MKNMKKNLMLAMSVMAIFGAMNESLRASNGGLGGGTVAKLAKVKGAKSMKINPATTTTAVIVNGLPEGFTLNAYLPNTYTKAASIAATDTTGAASFVLTPTLVAPATSATYDFRAQGFTSLLAQTINVDTVYTIAPAAIGSNTMVLTTTTSPTNAATKLKGRVRGTAAN